MVEQTTASRAGATAAAREQGSPVFRGQAPSSADHTRQRILGNALAAFRRNNLDRSERLAEQARRRWPQDADALQLLGLIAWNRQEHRAAVAKLKAAISHNPAKLEYRTNLAAVYRSVGDTDAARRELAQVLSMDSENRLAHRNLANLLRDLGEIENAATHYTKAIWLQPDRVEIWADFAAMLFENEHWADGMEVLDQAAAWEKDALAVGRTTASFLFQRKRPYTSVAVLRETITRHGEDLDSLVQLVRSLFSLERYREAFQTARRAMRVDRESVPANHAMAHALWALRQFRWAVRFMEYCVEQAPRIPQHRIQMAQLVGWMDADTTRQKRLCEEALEINPTFGPAFAQLSQIAQIEGDFDAARDYVQKAMRYMPQAPGPVMQFYNMQKDITEEDDIATVLARLESHENITINQLAVYNHTLGNLFDKVKSPERAIFYYKAANALNQVQWKKKGAAYNRERVERVLAENREIFTRDFIREMQDAYGHPSARPLFIVGMPRSGTTLVEQIVSSHPQVAGAGELAKMTQLVGAATQRHTPKTAGEQRNYPLWVPEASADELHNMAEAYLSYLDEFDTDADHVSDKMPHNFQMVGIISILFPNAKILHCDRDPVDTCLSCFRQNFAAPHPYSLDLSDLGHHYRQYEAYMAHWRAVLPGSQFMDVPYEGLVQDQERVTAQVLEHIGLPWDDACLQFHQKERAVKTASLAQVRQPIYTKSMKKWKQYAPYIGELFQALGEYAPDDPEVHEAIAQLQAKQPSEPAREHEAAGAADPA